MKQVKQVEPMYHLSKRTIDSVSFPWPIDDADIARIKAQCRNNPARVWPSQLASEWDISEGLAKRFIQGRA